MLLLAVDTSGKNGSLGLARARSGDAGVEVIEEAALAGGNFSAQLIPQTAELLARHGFKKTDLAGFVVVSGPGSFTGLRVGLAAIKALAEVLARSIAAVSLLEAVARSSGAPHVFSILDAGRGDFYVGDYELGPPVHMLSERLLSREEFVAESKSKDALVVTTDLAIADFLRGSGFRVELVGYPGIGEIARLGWERILRGETVLPENLEANYIRRTDAEIFSKPKP